MELNLVNEARPEELLHDRGSTHHTDIFVGCGNKAIHGHAYGYNDFAHTLSFLFSREGIKRFRVMEASLSYRWKGSSACKNSINWHLAERLTLLWVLSVEPAAQPQVVGWTVASNR